MATGEMNKEPSDVEKPCLTLAQKPVDLSGRALSSRLQTSTHDRFNFHSPSECSDLVGGG